MVEAWAVQIVPRPEAGIEGIPTTFRLGKGLIEVDTSPSERGGPPGDAAD